MGTPLPGVACTVSQARAPGGGWALIPEAAGSPGPAPAGSESCAPGIVPPAARDAAVTGLASGRPGTRHALQRAIAGHPGHTQGHFSSDGGFTLLRFTLQTFSASPDAKPLV